MPIVLETIISKHDPPRGGVCVCVCICICNFHHVLFPSTCVVLLNGFGVTPLLAAAGKLGLQFSNVACFVDTSGNLVSVVVISLV